MIQVEYQPGRTVTVDALHVICAACGDGSAIEPSQINDWFMAHHQPNITHAFVSTLGEWLPVRVKPVAD